MKKVRVKSAIPIFGVAAIWLIMGLAAPMYKLIWIITALALSVGGYIALSKLFPGRLVEKPVSADSGDEAVNAQIDGGRATLRRIHLSNEAIPDADMTARISRMEKAGEAIFGALEKDSSKAAQVRRFMNYYLPTADKLLTRYRELSAVGGRGENVTGAIKTISDSMEMIATAFEKQLDALYRDSALDIETDIDVLETLMTADGKPMI